MGKNAATIKTPDMGLMTVMRRPEGVAIRHEASGQVQNHRRMSFDEAVAHVKGGAPLTAGEQR